jgi:hypothetical protein
MYKNYRDEAHLHGGHFKEAGQREEDGRHRDTHHQLSDAVLLADGTVFEGLEREEKHFYIHFFY